MESEFQPIKKEEGSGSRRPNRRAPDTNNTLDASLRSSSSSGVGIASSYLQNQISLQRSRNDWDEDDPMFLARKESFDKGHLEEEELTELAFRPNNAPTAMGQSKSNPEVCSIPTTINACLSAPNDLGYTRNSFTFEDSALTMDASQRSGSAGALNIDDESSAEHIGDIGSEKELSKLLTANHNFMNRDDEADSSSSSSESENELDASGCSELDNVYRKGTVVGSQDSLDSVHSSNHSGHYSNEEMDNGMDLDTTPKMANGDVAQGTDLPLIPSPASDHSPSSTDTLHGLENINPLNISNHSRQPSFTKKQRTLSTVSLVSLLKIQSISEHDTFNDELKEIDLEKTAQMSEDGEGSVVSDLGIGESWRDGAAGAADIQCSNEDKPASNVESDDSNNSEVDSDGTDGTETDCDEDAVRIDIIPLNSGKSSPSNALDISEISDDHLAKGNPKPKSTGSFLPLPYPEQKLIQNPPARSRSSSLKSQGNSPVEGEDSSTFFLQSIKSTDNVTHVSDAPDYDYNSISSSDEDQKAVATLSDANGGAQSAGFISPDERRRLSAERQVSDKVCGLLGLPKDEGARKLNRGIMSKDTELQLRNLLKKEENAKLQQDDSAAADPEATPATNGSESDDSADQKKLEDAKWEAIRQERLVKRQSSRLSKRTLSGCEEKESPEHSQVTPQDANSNTNGDVSKSRPIIVNEAKFDETNQQPIKSTGLESDDKSVHSEYSSSSAELVQNSAWRKRSSTSSSSGQANSSVSFAENRILPKRAMPPKSTCPIQMVEKDDGSVFSNFSKSFRRGLLGRMNRDSETSIESNIQSLNSKPALKRNDSYMNFFGSKNPVSDDESRSHRGSKSSRSSRRKSSLAVFLGWQAPSFEEEENASSDDESTDDEGDETTWNKNILSEGEYYLAMSMLVYMYALLRETAMLGHTDITFDEVDVNSFQSELSDSGADGIIAKTKSAGFIIRVVLDELEKKGAFETVSDMSVLKEFKKWVHDSRCKQLDLATESTIKELRRKVARTRWRRAITTVRITIRLKKSSSQIVFDRNKLNSDPPVDRRAKRVSSLSARNRPAALSQSMMWVSSAKSQIMSSLGVSAPNGNQSTEKLTPENKLVGNDEIKQIIDDALEQPRFFRQGSLMSNLIESGIEVVWFGDRHPNDVVYSICCNRKQKRVSVVFRGTVNSHNWLMNMKFSMAEHVNPIAEDYYGRTSFFGLHTGFSLYLSRQRKDDSNTKIEEIFLMIDQIGRAIAPDGDYELSITGHSLGGALATLLSFYAATSSMFDNLKTIRVFSFAAPRVGDQRFLYAFQHLEQIGKLRLARFSNTQDVVPLIPFTCVDGFKIGRPYMHVGMHVRLHGTSNWSQYWLRNALDVTYPKQEGMISHIKRGFLNSVFTNLNTLKGFVKNHTLSEYQRRIHFALEYRNALAKTSLKYDKRRNRVKTLEEYYFIRGATTVTCTRDLTKVNLETRENERNFRQLRQMMIALVIIALVECIALLKVLDVSLSCQSVPKLVYPLLSLVCNDLSADVTPATEIAVFDAPISSEPEAAFAPESTGEEIEPKAKSNQTITTEDGYKPSDNAPDLTKNSKMRNITLLDDRSMSGAMERSVESEESLEVQGIGTQDVPKRRWNHGNNIFYKTNLVWGIRSKLHYEMPISIIEQRMSTFDPNSILEIPLVEASPDIEDTSEIAALGVLN